MEEELKENRIPKTTAAFMLTVALFYDVLQIFFDFIFIGFLINWGISLVAFLTFYVWFKLHGVSLGDSAKKIASLATNYFLDILSGGIFPSIFISTLLTILIVKGDDMLYNRGINLNLSTSSSQQKKRQVKQQEVYTEEEGGETSETQAPIAKSSFNETLQRVANLKTNTQESKIARKTPLSSSAAEVIPTTNFQNKNKTGILGRISRQKATN